MLVAAIYGWAVYQQRDLRRRQTFAPDAPGFDLRRLRPVPEGNLPALTDRFASAVDDEAAGMPAELITLHVAAMGQPFAGRAILDAMQATDLRYGPMKIFHRCGAGSVLSTPPLFSVADMFEPGSFDLDAMDGFSTRGLSLFMNARTTVDAGSVFDDMLGVAEMLARLLGGEMLGDDRQKLDAGRIAAIRARLDL